MESKSKKILIWVLVCVAIILLLGAILVYYFFYDVFGLELYNDETIQSIYKYNDQIYLVDEDGKGYVLGGYSDSSGRTYLNSENQKHKGLNSSTPVLFFDGNIQKLIPYDSMSTLIITNDFELYNWCDFEIKQIASSVVSADASAGKGIYYINQRSELIMSEKNGAEKVLLTDVIKVVLYRDSAYVLLKDKSLNEMTVDESGNVALSLCEINGVVDFDVVDTSIRYNGEKYVYGDEIAVKNPLISVLCDDGNMYVKGAYNLLNCYTNLADEKPQPHIIDDWTLIGEEVSSFSSAPMGTVMLLDDGSCEYYGFDTSVSIDSEFKSFCIPISGIKYVHASETTICLVSQDNKIYIYGDDAFNPLLYRATNRHHIFKDSPLVISCDGKVLQD